MLAGFTLLYVLFFAPVLFSNRLLAPGDGIIYFLPNFASPRVFWDPTIWGGFPAVGDSQLMLWYPPAIIFSLFGAAGYQPFLISGFVLASAFAYGYMFSVTRSYLAATISGCVYGLSGFMITHLGHAALIHSAVWLPLIIWSFSELQRTKLSRGWIVIATVAIACAALAGHPQIFAYTLVLATAFVIITGSEFRWRYYILSAAILALGIGLAALQLIPTAELAGHSWRAALSFSEFNAYGLTLRQIPVLLFPFLYGGSPASFYGLPYFGAWPSSADGWGAGELSGYAGLLPLLLAAIGFWMNRRTTRARFWLAVALIALLLALGSATPLAWLTYRLPVINKFRAPARHFLELTFAISILSGLGVHAIQHAAAKIRAAQVIAGAAIVIVATVVAIVLFRSRIDELAIQRMGHTISLKPFSNPALLVPLIILVAASIALLWWRDRPRSSLRVALLLLVLLLDLASFGWFCEWRYRAPYKAYLRPPAAADKIGFPLKQTAERFLPVRGGTGRVNEMPPNLSKLWGIDSASGYGPFILTRTSELLTMPPHGSVDDSWRDPLNQNLDLMGVAFVILPPDALKPMTFKDERGLSWSSSDFNVQIGSGCDAKNPADFRIDLPKPVSAARIGIVSALACSIPLGDKQTVATLKLTDINHQTISLSLAAGSDSSEWAFDCADVRPVMKQSRARVFRSYPVTRGEIKCEGHDYISVASTGWLRWIKTIELHATDASATFSLKKLSLINDLDGVSTPINAPDPLDDERRWQQVAEINYRPDVKPEEIGASIVFANLRARPRVWLASEVLRVSPAEAFTAVRASKLPDGRPFDAARTALVEEPLDFPAQTMDENRQAQITQLLSSEMEVRVTGNAPSFLVTSDAFYPGWTAKIDGAPAQLYRTDYALRGVSVPAGTHTVRFEFRPRSFYYGLVVSGISLLGLIAVAWFWPKR